MPKSVGEVVKTYLVTNRYGRSATLREYQASKQTSDSGSLDLINCMKECDALVCAIPVPTGLKVQCSINYLNTCCKAEGSGISS